MRKGFELMEEDKTEKGQSKGGCSSTIFGFLILVIAMTFAHAIFRHPVDQTQNVKATWNKYYFGITDPRISMTLPNEPKQKTMDIPADVNNMIKMIDSYECNFSLDKISILIINALYKDGITPNLQGGIDGALSSISNLKGISKIQHTTSPIIISGKEGKILTVIAEQDGKQLEMKTVFLLEGLKMWQIIIDYEPTNKKSKEAAQKVIESISF